MTDCICDIGMGNLGRPSCIKLVGGLQKLVFTETRGSDGTLNKIALADAGLTQAYIDGKVNELNAKDRWFVSPEITDFVSTKEDPDIKEFNDKTRRIISEGRRSFTGMILDADMKFKELLDANTCLNRGVYIITDEGNVLGLKKDNSGDTYPIPVEMFYSKQGFERGENDVQEVSFVLDIPLIVKDTTLQAIYSTETSGDVAGLEGLIQLSATLDNPTTSGYDLTLKGDGQYGWAEAYEGLVASDLVAYNVTAGASATITSVTATATPGVYTIVFTGAVSTNVYRVSPSADLHSDHGVTFNEISLPLS